MHFVTACVSCQLVASSILCPKLMHNASSVQASYEGPSKRSEIVYGVSADSKGTLVVIVHQAALQSKTVHRPTLNTA